MDEDVRVVTEYGGANDGGDRPTHIMLSAESIRNAGMRPRWYRYRAVATAYGEWKELGDS